MTRSLSRLQQGLLALAAGSLVAVLSATGLLAPFDLPVEDLLLRPGTAGGPPAASPVVAVLLDDASLETLGPRPWPRAVVAALVDLAFDRGARGVVLDLLLAEPAPGDDALDRALDGRPVVLAAALHPDGGWLLPLERLGGAARAAHAEGELGPDGVVRSVLATKQRAGEPLPALALAAARLVRPELPVTPGAELRPAFRVPPERVPRISALELLSGGLGGDDPAARGLLDGRLAFVGSSATGAGDRFPTPTGSRPVPGVLIHAATAAALLEGSLLHTLPPWMLLAGCLAAAAVPQALRSRAGRLRVAHFVVAGVVLAALVGAAFWTLDLLLPPVTLVLAFGLSALLREVAESGVAQRETGRLLARLAAEDAAEQTRPEGTTSRVAPGGGTTKTVAPGGSPGGWGHGAAPPPGAAGRLALARELQERLIRDRDLRRTLLDSLEDGVVRWGPDGRVMLANRAAARLWGDPPPSLDRLREVVRRATADGASGAVGVQGDRGAGEGVVVARGRRQLRVLVRPVDGGSLGVLRDVTAERELEDRRREMQRLVSHELKTPLASIASFGSMLERYQLSDDELSRLAGLIRGESERLLGMVTTFLDLERLGSGRFDVERRPLDLAELAAGRCEVHRAAADAEGIALELERSGDCRVAGDPVLLERAIDNLVGNAVKYCPAGSTVSVSVLGPPPEPAEPDPRVELRVADDGPGIPPEALPRLFERFYRVPGAGRGDRGGSRGAGSGLGLALVREIAEWHGGCVDASSEPGGGSVFTVLLPPLSGGEDGSRS